MSEAVLFNAVAEQSEKPDSLRYALTVGTTFGAFPASPERFQNREYGGSDLAYLTAYQFLGPVSGFSITDGTYWAAAISAGPSLVGVDGTIRFRNAGLTLHADSREQWQGIVQYRQPATSTRWGLGLGGYYRKEGKGITYGCAPEAYCLDFGFPYEYATLRSYGARLVVAPPRQKSLPIEAHLQIGYARDFDGPVVFLGVVVPHYF